MTCRVWNRAKVAYLPEAMWLSLMMDLISDSDRELFRSLFVNAISTLKKRR
jgi:hypothetical protein